MIINQMNQLWLLPYISMQLILLITILQSDFEIFLPLWFKCWFCNQYKFTYLPSDNINDSTSFNSEIHTHSTLKRFSNMFITFVNGKLYETHLDVGERFI